MITDSYGEVAHRAYLEAGEIDPTGEWNKLSDEEATAWNAAAGAAIREYDAFLAGEADRKAELLLSAPTWTDAQEAAQRAEEERARAAVNPADQMAEAQRIMDEEAAGRPVPEAVPGE